jgi:hypothetical protein
MTITRSPGIHIGHGYIAGGGYTGVTYALDATVKKAAEALAAAYPDHDVTIRFNSDQESGGAWLVTDPFDGIWSNAEIGIGASVITQKHYDRREKDPDLYEGQEPLPPVGTVIIDAKVGERVVIGSSKREDRYVTVSSIEEALAFVQEHGDLGKLVEWHAEQKRISEERARVFAAYVKTIRGIRRQEYAEACWQALEMNNGKAWCEPRPKGIPYEVECTLRRRTRAIWSGVEIAGEMLVSRYGQEKFPINSTEYEALCEAAANRSEALVFDADANGKLYLLFPMPRWQAEVVAKLRGLKVDADV